MPERFLKVRYPSLRALRRTHRRALRAAAMAEPIVQVDKDTARKLRNLRKKAKQLRRFG